VWSLQEYIGACEEMIGHLGLAGKIPLYQVRMPYPLGTSFRDEILSVINESWFWKKVFRIGMAIAGPKQVFGVPPASAGAGEFIA